VLIKHCVWRGLLLLAAFVFNLRKQQIQILLNYACRGHKNDMITKVTLNEPPAALCADCKLVSQYDQLLTESYSSPVGNVGMFA